MNNYRDLAGVFLLIALMARFANNSENRLSGMSLPSFSGLASEFHKVTGVMGKIDNLGQYALTMPSAIAEDGGKLPFPGSTIIPDMSELMNTIGPLLKNFKDTEK